MHKNLNTCFAGFTHTHICPDLRALTDCRKTFDVLEFWADDVPSSSLRRQMSTRRWRSMWFGITMPQFQQYNILCDTVLESIQEQSEFTTPQCKQCNILCDTVQQERIQEPCDLNSLVYHHKADVRRGGGYKNFSIMCRRQDATGTQCKTL